MQKGVKISPHDLNGENIAFILPPPPKETIELPILYSVMVHLVDLELMRSLTCCVFLPQLKKLANAPKKTLDIELYPGNENKPPKLVGVKVIPGPLLLSENIVDQ